MAMFPCSHMHLVPDDAQRQAMLAAMLAFLTDTVFVYMDVAGNGLLPVEAERQGKLVVTTELGALILHIVARPAWQRPTTQAHPCSQASMATLHPAMAALHPMVSAEGVRALL